MALTKVHNRLIANAQANVKDFGAIGDGSADDTVAIQAAVNSGHGSVFIPSGTYNISSTIVVPYQVNIIGENARTTKIQPVTGGTFTSSYMLFFNTTNGTTWTNAYPNIGSGGMSDVDLYNGNSISGMKGVAAAGSYEFTNIRSYKMDCTIHITADYNDKVAIKRVYMTEATGSDYQIIVNQLGDALIIENVHSPLTSGSVLPKTIKLIGCTGGALNGNLAGDIELYRCSNVTVRNTHTEGGTLKIDSSTVKVDGYWCTPNIRSEANIILLATDDGKYAVEIVGYHNAVWDNRIPDPYYEFDLQTHSDYQISIYDCYKRWYRSGNISLSDITGIQVENEAGSALTDFNESSFRLSVSSSIRRGQIVVKDQNVDCGTGVFNSLGDAQTYSSVEWTGTTGTYYYHMQYLYDIDKLIGRTDSDGEQSFSLTNEGDAVLFPLSYASRNPNAICRIYRGTSAGSYDKYVDVPMVCSRYLYDDGKQVSGVIWKSRTAGGVDTPNTSATNITYAQDNVRLISNAVPAVGTYARGDIVYSSEPSAGGVIGWVCVTAGTPGTWKTFGTIAS